MTTINPAHVLATRAGVAPEELAAAARALVNGSNTGVNALSSLDAALVEASAGARTSTLSSFQSMTQTTNTETHIVEKASTAYKRAPSAGFAESGFVAGSPSPSALAQSGSAAAERIKAHPYFSAQASTSTATADGDLGATQTELDSDSRQLQFEKLKNEMNKISQMTTMLTNVLKSMNDMAMSAIRNIKA